MIDAVCIFTTGGVLLFYKAFVALKFDPIDMFISPLRSDWPEIASKIYFRAKYLPFTLFKK